MQPQTGQPNLSRDNSSTDGTTQPHTRQRIHKWDNPTPQQAIHLQMGQPNLTAGNSSTDGATQPHSRQFIHKRDNPTPQQAIHPQTGQPTELVDVLTGCGHHLEGGLQSRGEYVDHPNVSILGRGREGEGGRERGREGEEGREREGGREGGSERERDRLTLVLLVQPASLSVCRLPVHVCGPQAHSVDQLAPYVWAAHYIFAKKRK